MLRILIQEGSDRKVLGNFFKAVVQAVLLFGAETWVPNPSMEQALSSFQHRVSRRLTGRQMRSLGDGSWDYPLLAAVMEEAGFEEIGAYVTRRKNAFTKYIMTGKIQYLYERYV